MSNPGLYSGIYQQIREYAELVDNVLISLKGEQDSEKALRTRLSERLSELIAEQANMLSTRLIGLLVVGDDPASRARWSRLATALKAEKVEPSAIRELETLAQVLEHAQVDAMAKMRGWSH